jgi:hypothetical protein
MVGTASLLIRTYDEIRMLYFMAQIAPGITSDNMLLLLGGENGVKINSHFTVFIDRHAESQPGIGDGRYREILEERFIS